MPNLQLTEDYRCGYCYRQFYSMTDPRELPCHDVFCLSCLEEDYSEHKNLRCRSCLSKYNEKIFDELPKAELHTEVPLSPTLLNCDCPECNGKPAVSYCVDCAAKMCDTRQQDHSWKLGESHEILPISTYIKAPLVYKKVLCHQHHVKVCQVCEKCQLLLCEECDKEDKGCTDASIKHAFIPLESLDEKITANLQSVLNFAGNKLSEICEINKQMLKTQDEENAECARRIEMIDRVCDIQILKVEEKSENLHEDVYRNRDRLKYKMRSYMGNWTTQRRRIEVSCAATRRWLIESNFRRKMEQTQQMVDALMNNMNIHIDYPALKPPILIETGIGVIEKPKLAKLPLSLSKKYEYCITSACYSTTYGIGDRLVLGCDDGVKVLGKDGSIRYEYPEEDKVISVQAYGNSLYILMTDGTKERVYQCLADMSEKQVLFSFPKSSSKLSCIAVSYDYIAAVNPDEKQLLLYNFCTKRVQVQLSHVILSGIHFLPDGDLLVVNLASGSLIRYKIESNQLITVWECEELDKVHDVTSDADGFIYLSGRFTKAICIVSPEGTKLTEIKDENLLESWPQISIRGRDKLAMSSPYCNSVLVFEINH